MRSGRLKRPHRQVPGESTRTHLLLDGGGIAKSIEIQLALRASPAFRNWSDAAIGLLAAHCRMTLLARGEGLVSNDGLHGRSYLIRTGCLVLHSQPDLKGLRRHAVGFLGEGDLVCDLILDEATTDQRSASAQQDTTLIELPSKRLQELLDRTPAHWIDLMTALLEQEESLTMSVIGHLTGSAPQRVCWALVQCARLFDRTPRLGVGVNLRISQDEVASLLQLSRATVGRELSALEKRGLIHRRYSQIHVRCAEGLKKHAAAQ